ncbi:serine-rich adhesin for platelets-like [Dermacentor albipictus]|uniref:serine-rich adhesin for platelets-like n=1 Tax=Dermacentor albipictus TaxID=60249 RepID=UPI0031FC33C7
MESPTKVGTVNGTLQTATKHQDMRLETGVEGNGYGRAETIEDIISELNATAKKDVPLSEEPFDVMLLGQQSLVPDDRCDPTTDSKAPASSIVDGCERDSTPASTREESKPPTVATSVSVSAEGENIVASRASEIDSEDASKVENAANGDSNQPLKCQKASEYINTLETDAAEKPVNECNDKETTKAVPDLTDADVGSDEVITSDIKAPDEAVMSPRRTARQRTASLKLTESVTSTPSRKRRHGSEASDVSSVDTPPSTKQESKQSCITSDSEVDVPLAKRRCRMLSADGSGTKATVKTNRLTSDSEGDSPLVKLKRSPKLANRLASNNEGNSSLAKRKRIPKLASKVTSESESDSPLVKRMDSAKVAKKITEHSQTRKGDVQSAEPPSKKISKKNLLEEFPENKIVVKSDNDGPGLQSSEQNSTKRGKPTDSKRVQNLVNKAKRKAVHEERPLSSTSVDHSTHESREESCEVSKPKKAKDKAGSNVEGILDSSGAASAMVGKKKRLMKSKELKNDSAISLNVGDIGGSVDTESDETGNSFLEQNSFAQSAEAVSSWSPNHFKASDHRLQKSIQLSLKDWVPSVRPSYLTIEVPSVNARRMWGPGFSRQRPTVVFGGCDPLNTYVNVDGVRVLLLQWQKVSNIIPTIRLTDIFQCFKHT